MSPAPEGTVTEPTAEVADRRLLARGWFYLLLALAILGLDLATGPFLQFPILFVVPVGLAAWYYDVRGAYALAVALPLGRLAIALNVDLIAPGEYALANAAIRIAVLVLLAFFIGRTAQQTRRLHDRVSGLVRICAWSRTVEYRGEWLSFEEYLKRRFRLEATHGVSPAQVEKLLEELRAAAPPAGDGGSGRN